MSAFFVNYTENQEIWHVFRSACLQRFRHAEQQTSRQATTSTHEAAGLDFPLQPRVGLENPWCFCPLRIA